MYRISNKEGRTFFQCSLIVSYLYDLSVYMLYFHLAFRIICIKNFKLSSQSVVLFWYLSRTIFRSAHLLVFSPWVGVKIKKKFRNTEKWNFSLKILALKCTGSGYRKENFRTPQNQFWYKEARTTAFLWYFHNSQN